MTASKELPAEVVEQIEDPKNNAFFDKKKTEIICFKETSDMKARFYTALRSHNIRQSVFLRMCIFALATKDPLMLEFVDKRVDKTKHRKGLPSPKGDLKKEEKVKEDFNLSGNDVENLFDIFEEENGL